MSNLEDLVPPLELCRQIPEGKFADSVMVYAVTKHSLNYCFGGRRCFINDYRELIPAPTLQEIIAELTPGEDSCGEITQFGKDKHGWFTMASFEGNDDGYGSGFETYEEIDRDNPATAALKLWLEVNKLDRTDKTNKTNEDE